jgi:LemA protein
MAGLIVVAVVILLPLLIVVGMYNGLVRARNHCTEAWSNVDTELKRRYDLIPNLVNTVKGYATHERELLENVTRLRAECMRNNGSPQVQAQTENELVRLLSALMIRVEDYPDLKASTNFLELQQELVNTEDRIQAARRFYNGNVRENNNLVQTFPSNVIARTFGFGEREFFEIEDVAMREAPQVKL